MMKRLRVLVVTAHPDDESWLAGSTIRRLASAGHQVFVLTFTPGDNAWLVRIGHVTRRTMQQVRRRELQAACRLLGITACTILEFRDGHLDRVSLPRLARPLLDALERRRPNVVLTFAPDGISGHADHRTVRHVVSQVVRRRKLPVPVFEFTYPARLKRRFGFRFLGRKKLLKIRTTPASRKAKLRAIEIHSSQPKTVDRLHALTPSQLRDFLEFEYVVASPSASVFCSRFLS